MSKNALVLICACAFAFAGCVKKDEPKVTTAPPPMTLPTQGAVVAVAGLTVGNSVGVDKKVHGAATIIPKDTIYVSIDTTGSGEATLKSRWTYLEDGRSQLVNEDMQKVRPNGPATHEFHISKPDGWPKGEYQVEVFVNDASAATRRFKVT